MLTNKAKSVDEAAASITKKDDTSEGLRGGGVFKVECRDKDGNLKWAAESHNLVVDVGLQDMNSKYFTGSSYTAAWYIGIYGSGASNTPAGSDTMALHPGWTEITPYSNATRPVATFGTASTADPSVITNSASPAQFNINTSATVGGAFLVNNNTKGGSTGILFSASDFQAPGDRSVTNGDTLNVTYTFSLDAA